MKSIDNRKSMLLLKLKLRNIELKAYELNNLTRVQNPRKVV